MRLLILLALVGLSLAAPQSPQVYAFDYFNHEENRAQFLRRNGEAYSWGYEFPERVHLENSKGPGYVEGSYGYVDANGVPILVQYQSDPTNGFTADIQEAPSVDAFGAERSIQEAPSVEAFGATRSIQEAPSVEAYGAARPESLPQADVSVYSALLNELPMEGNLAAPAPLLAMLPTQPNLTPLLKSFVRSGKITQLEILEDGSSTFVISPDTVQEAGSISNLAVQLGATLPAAVHDVRSPNPSNQESRPVLDYHNNLHVLRVPAADPSVGPLIIEI